METLTPGLRGHSIQGDVVPNQLRCKIVRNAYPISVDKIFGGFGLLDASQAYADLMARVKAGGKADGYIAATAAAHGLMVATRDTSPFQAAELNTINPWEAVP